MKRILFAVIAVSCCSEFAVGQDAAFTGYATSVLDAHRAEIRTNGFKDKSKTIPYDSLTLQPVGSVSKVVVGLAIMKACELGYVNLDTDINQYLNFKVVNPNVKNSRPITIRHLATHTSGIKDNEKFYLQTYTKGLASPYSLGDFLASYFAEKGERYSKANFGNYPAGEEYNYSNMGAALAAYVVEYTSNVPFDQFTEKHIFGPLKMTQTHWFYDEKNLGQYAQLFDEKDKPLEFYSLATYPDGAMKTTVCDLTRLLQALIRGYQGESGLLSQASWKVFFAKNFTDERPVRGLNPKEPNCGIFIVYAKSGAIGHTGSDPGLCAFMFFDPQELTGRIFMGNEDLTAKNLDSFKVIWDGLQKRK